MILTINIENTIISLGVFDDDSICFSASIATQQNKTEFQYATSFQQVLSLYHINSNEIKGVMIASVVPILTPKVKLACELLFSTDVLVVSAGIKTGLNLKVSTATLGADFVCSAVCAINKYQTPCIITALGTATTFCAIDKNNVFCGTSIAAGIQISLEALRKSAAQLPQIGIEKPRSILGTNTVSSMQSGLIYGTASMIDGMCKRFSKQLKETPCYLATGQYAQNIVPFCDTPFVTDCDLVLKGLYYIFMKNKKQ